MEVVFELTKGKTEVIVGEYRADITDTEVEKIFVRLLKKLQEHQKIEQIYDALCEGFEEINQ